MISDPTLFHRRSNPVASVFALALAGTAVAYEPVTDVPADFKMPQALSLEASVASLKVRPGLRVELVAAEPLVMDPVNLDWGPDGRLWVVEMGDYPLGIDGKGDPGGRVRFLEDSDGDGKYDRSTVFLERLNFPTAVKPWRDGVLVIACPEILFAKDGNGDGKADQIEVLYRGFREGNQQHRVNGLEWGLDGWLYVANGDSGGTVESVKTGQKVELGGFDLAIHPDTGGLRLETGRTQYGRVRDDEGNWFGCNNSRPIFHFQLSDSMLRRNPHAVYPPAVADIDSGPDPRRVFPISQGGQRYNDPKAENRFTSACGLAIYRDSRLGESFRGDAFICEPVHNLVSRRKLVPEGATFRAIRAGDEQDSEFLASTDHWFRPVAAKTGPDGGLWVVDMHRYVIEHPEWIPAPWQKVLDLRAGHDRGRIYRVVSEGCVKSAVPKTDAAAPGSGWWSDRAHMERQWQGKDDPVTAMPSEAHLVELARSAKDARKAYGAAESLGRFSTPAAGQALAELMIRFSADPLVVAAANSSLIPHLETVSARLSENPAAAPLWPNLFDTAVALKRTEALASLLRPENAAPAFLGVLDRRSIDLETYRQSVSPPLHAPLDRILSQIRDARPIALDAAASADKRLAASALLGRLKASRGADLDALLTLLGPGSPAELQHAAAARLLELGELARSFAAWKTLSPAVRSRLIGGSLTYRNQVEALLGALADGTVPKSSIDAATRQRLVGYPQAQLRKRAAELFGAAANPDRAAVLAAFAPAVKLAGDPAKGREHFTARCAVCHQLGGIGRTIGADLAALADKSPGSLLTAILDPNAAVEDKYLLYQIDTAKSESLAGMIVAETGPAVRLLMLDGTERDVPRDRIAKLQSTGRSAMPEGLEAGLDAAAMADLIAFLRAPAPAK